MTKRKTKEIANTVNSFDLEQLRENILNSSYPNDPCVFENTKRRLRDNKKEFILKSIFALSLGVSGIGLTLINAIAISFSPIKSIFGLIGGLCLIGAGILNIFIAKESYKNLKHKLTILSKNTNLSEEEVIAILKSDRFNELLIDNQVDFSENQMLYEIQEDLIKTEPAIDKMQSKNSPAHSTLEEKKSLLKRIVDKFKNAHMTNDKQDNQTSNKNQIEHNITNEMDENL